MELLRRIEDRGYPVEYLLSRIRGRRSRLIRDWRPLVYDTAPMDYLASPRYQGFVRDRSTEGVWRSLIREYRWVYSQMNARFRELFGPYFLYTEFRTIFTCLRYLKDRKKAGSEDLLKDSLLSAEMAGLLLESPEIRSAIRGIERAFLPLSEQFGNLGSVFETEGLRGVELRLTNTYLAVIACTARSPLFKAFFSKLIDSRNILGLYKCLRMERPTLFPFIAGGAISETRFKAIFGKGDLAGVIALVRDYFGIKIDAPDTTKVETALYRGMTGFLRREGRDPLGAGPVLDYLWKCSLEVMNLSVLYHAKDLERDVVTAELVQ